MFYKKLLFLAPIVLACNVNVYSRQPGGDQPVTNVDFKIQSYFLDGNDLWGLRPDKLEVNLNGYKKNNRGGYENQPSADTGISLNQQCELAKVTGEVYDFKESSGKITVKKSNNQNPRIEATWPAIDGYKCIEPEDLTNTSEVTGGGWQGTGNNQAYDLDSIYQLESYPIDINVAFDMKGWNSIQPTQDIKVSISAGGTTTQYVTLTNSNGYELTDYYFFNETYSDEPNKDRLEALYNIGNNPLNITRTGNFRNYKYEYTEKHGLPNFSDMSKYTINVPEIDGFVFNVGNPSFDATNEKFKLNITATLQTTTIEPKITWDDYNNKMQKRPNSVVLKVKDVGDKTFEISSTDSWSKEFTIPSSIASSFSFEGSEVPDLYKASYDGQNVTYTYNGDLLYAGTWIKETIDGLDFPSSVTTSQSAGNEFTYVSGNTTFLVKNGNTFDLKLADTDNWWFDVVPNHDDLIFTIFARGYAVANKAIPSQKYKTLEDADTEENAAYELIALKNIDISNITLNNPLWINTDKWTLRAHSISATQGATIIVNARGTLDLDINKNVVVRCEEGAKLIFD